MILVWGSAQDAPLARVLQLLHEHGGAFLHIDMDQLARLRHDITLGPTPSGWLEVDGVRVDVSTLRGIYLRPLQSVSGRAAAGAAVLLGLAALSPALVINPPAAGLSNASKPYQLRLIAQAGLAVPKTLVTSDPAAALAFVATHGRVIYKSISGVRSVVSALSTADSTRLLALGHGPVQLQRWVAGRDVRVHVVGQRCFASAVDSQATDYRYAARDGLDVQLSAMDIPVALQRRLVALNRALGLHFSGIDLRRGNGGIWTCFEVNPSPGFTFYEDATGQDIGEAVVELLMQGSGPRARRRAPSASRYSVIDRNGLSGHE